MVGFWLAFSTATTSTPSTTHNYVAIDRYGDDAHSARGLSDLAERVLAYHLPPGGWLLLLATGGRRESHTLARLGFDVEGHECNSTLVEHVNGFLARAGVSSRVCQMARDETPARDATFDGIIVGWSGYMLIAGRYRRAACRARFARR